MAALESLLDGARGGSGGAIVVRGEAGIGKSAHLDVLASNAADCTILRCTGVETEYLWSFAALQVLLRPIADRIGALPESQRRGMAGILGMEDVDEEPPDGRDRRFRIGLGVLNLLTEAAGERPVLCIVDDAHWVDADSIEVLLFAARRIAAERVAVVFAARDGYAPDFPAPGIPELRIGPLDDDIAASILDERLGGGTPWQKQRLLREAAGNPLALLELPVEDHEVRMSSVRRSRYSTTSRLSQAFTERIERLPEPTRTLLLVAAIEDSGDTDVVFAAAGKLGATLNDLEPAESDDLVHYEGGRFAFEHPLIRSAAADAPALKRLEVYRTIAEVLDPDDRRRVHYLAAAATAPDEAVAAALEESASCAGRCGGNSSGAAILERAADLSVDRASRGRRLVKAAELAHVAGQREKAVELAWLAERDVGDAALLARAAIVRAEIATWAGDVRPAYELWMEATERFASIDDAGTGYPLFRAVETAWMGADFDRAEIAAERAERLGIAHAPWVRSLAVAAAGLNRSSSYGAAEAVAASRRLIELHSEFHDRLDLIDQIILTKLRFFEGDLFGAESESAELVSRCRALGASGPLVWALAHLAHTQVHTGHFADAEASATAAIELAEELGHLSVLHVVLSRALAPVAALRGDTERCEELVRRAVAAAPKSTEVRPDFSLALLDVAHGRFEAALDRMLRIGASEAPMELLAHMPTVVEAAVRCGRADDVAPLFAWFTEWAEAAGTAHWSALLERCRGLLVAEDEAGAHFERAAELHSESPLSPFETARTDLVFGAWLRRTRRVAEGRSRLRAAAEAFERLGAEPWVERTRSELRAAGDSGEVAAEPGLAERLTPQELQVVRLAAVGLSNREIGEQLYLSPRTAGYHLYKAYPKLGVSSRTELARLKL